MVNPSTDPVDALRHIGESAPPSLTWHKEPGGPTVVSEESAGGLPELTAEEQAAQRAD